MTATRFSSGVRGEQLVIRPARTIRTKSSRWTAVELRGHRQWSCQRIPSCFRRPRRATRSERCVEVLSDVRVQRAIEAIVRAARTKKIGDGKVFVIAIDQVIRIRTKERGEAAI